MRRSDGALLARAADLSKNARIDSEIRYDLL